MASAVTAVILAAGQGTRMKSSLPKVLHAAGGKPLLAWPVEAARAVGATRVVVVVGHGRARVEEDLAQRFGPQVQTVLQAEQKGTGHAVQQALPALEGASGTVLVVYGDCPLITAQSLAALAALRDTTGASLALWTTRVADPTGYGRIVRDAAGSLDRIVEHKDASDAQRAIDEINPGVYAVDLAFLRRALPQLKPTNVQGELYLTDLVALARSEGGLVPTLLVPADETLGVNDKKQLAQASAVLRRRIIDAAMISGVTFAAPETCFVDATVHMAPDVEIGPNVLLAGTTTIAAGARIGPGCILKDTRVGEGATIHAYSVCDGAEIEKDAVVGPFARLRPGAFLDEGAHVGNFVEVKKSRIGKKSKANHLAYIGDAVIGSGTNVGAGTITCNYDGFGKYETRLGDDVFIGSNSTLVAPLSVGDGAYVAAGSVITDAVDKDALAFGRARQSNKAGHASKVRERAQAQAASAKGKSPA